MLFHKTFYFFLGVIVLSIFPGCASTNMNPSQVQTQEHILELAGEAKDATGTPKTDYIDATASFVVKSKAASASGAQPDVIKAFLDTGITVVNLYCKVFFDKITVAYADRSFVKSQLNSAAGLSSAVLGLTKANSLATGAAGAGFSFLNASFTNYDAAFLVSPDLPTVYSKVKEAQAQLAAELLDPAKKHFETFATAERSLAAYADLCDFVGIRNLVNESVATANPSPTPSGTSIMFR